MRPLIKRTHTDNNLAATPVQSSHTKQAVVVARNKYVNPAMFTNRFAGLVTEQMFTHTAEPAQLKLVNYNWTDAALEALSLIHEGKHILVCGAAGSGKTTLIIGDFLIRQLLEGRIYPVGQRPRHEYLEERCIPEHKSLRRNAPGFIACALAHKVKQRLMLEFPPQYSYTFGGVTYNVSISSNIMTAHRACEYKPVKIATEDDDGYTAEKRRFMPTRGADNILPDIQYVFVDEAGMLPLSTFRALVEACPRAQVICMSDVGQLGAVAGVSALEPMLAYGNAVELEMIYRNQGAVLEFATRIRAGEHYTLKRTRKVQPYVMRNGTVSPNIQFFCYEDDSDIDPRHKVSESAANQHCIKLMTQLIIKDLFVPGVDMCLCPQRPDSTGSSITAEVGGEEKFGINVIYPGIAEKLDEHYGRHTYYISTKRGPVIVAAGDIYYVDSEVGGQLEYMLVGITENTGYVTAIPRPPMLYATRTPYIWDSMLNAEQESGVNVSESLDLDNFDLDEILSGNMNENDYVQDTESKSQYTLQFLNLTALRTAVFGKVADKKGAYVLLRYVVKELFNLALHIDYTQNVAGCPMSAKKVDDEVFALLHRVHLDSVAQDLDDSGEELILNISRTSKIASMLPAAPITVHKSQGSESEFVVCLFHNSCRQMNREMLYTAVTRARQNVVILCNANTFGAETTVDGTVINSSAYTKPAIDRVGTDGITLAEKRATIKERMDNMMKRDPEGTGDIAWAFKYFGDS